MRKKKYLNERLEQVSDILFISDFEDRNYNTAIKEKEYLDLKNWFQNDNPLYLEIGCGKGKFACEYAATHPEINLLAVEKSGNVKVEACETAKKQGLKNVKFIKCGAEYLPKYLPPKSIDRIYLNFSCPFPKKAYASHRLTATQFLSIYERIVSDTADIHQKTDNRVFFEFSIESLSDYGFTIKNVSLDLHKSDFEGNIVTEYEARFSSLGFPIYRLEAYLKK
jgi:tRNA (guanine-N7-)-methyltransferase